MQVSETETPLHRLETVYRRLCENLTTAVSPPSAFRSVLDGWMFALEEDVLAEGDIDHFQALGFLQGLLTVLRDAGHPGLLVLDEIEILQRVRGDVREKGLNALRQLLDEIDAGRFPGLFLLITGTPAFFVGQQGVQRLPTAGAAAGHGLHHRPEVRLPRAVQLRLPGFDLVRLGELGRAARDLYVGVARNPDRVSSAVDDSYVAQLADSVTGGLGSQVGVAPRVFLLKLVANVLDRVDEHDDFDPRRHYHLTLAQTELTEVERNAAARNADDVELDLP